MATTVDQDRVSDIQRYHFSDLDLAVDDVFGR